MIVIALVVANFLFYKAMPCFIKLICLFAFLNYIYKC